MHRLSLGLAMVLGAGAMFNGVFMLVAPTAWYFAVPGVTTTGPFNQHFIRDIGMVYGLIGIAYLVGVARAHQRVALWGAASLWLSGHALFHLWEVAAGICGLEAIPRDFAGVTLPALLGVGLTAWAFRVER
ncbi:MAG: hypothetical protein ABW321_23090 [Polyangiales bacterium]